jgi:hypothetical protein
LSLVRLVIPILVISLIIICFILIVDYVKQQRAQDALISQINASSRALSLVHRPADNLTARLSEIEQAYQTANQALTESKVNSTEIIKALYQTADEFKLKADPLTTGPWSKKVIEGSNYMVMPLALSIEGSLSANLLFIERIENKLLFPFLAIENVSLADESGFNNQDNSPEATATITVEMNLTIFMRVEPGN